MRDFKDLKIAVAGTGYVGLSIATLLSQNHQVMAVDIVPESVYSGRVATFGGEIDTPSWSMPHWAKWKCRF